VVVAAVSEEHVRPSAWPSDDASHGWDLVQQGQELVTSLSHRSATPRAGRPGHRQGRGVCCPAVRGRPGWDRS
jgi:hypothetical protein